MEKPIESRPRTHALFLPVTAAVTVIYLALIWRTPSWLIGTPEYRWPILHHGLLTMAPIALLILFAASGAGLFLAAHVERIIKTSYGRTKVYCALAVLGLAFQLGPATVHRMGMSEIPLRVYLPDHTSYFTDAAGIEDLASWLKAYPTQAAYMATHTRTHPPGAVLLFYGARALMDRLPAMSGLVARGLPGGEKAMQRFGLTGPQLAAGLLCAVLLLLIASASVPLTFAVGRIMTTDLAAAVAAILFASMPAFAHKTPVLDHLLASLVLVSLWLTISALRKRQLWRVALAGVVIGAGLWLGTSLLAALPLCALFAAAGIFQFRRPETGVREYSILLLSLVALMSVVAFMTVTSLGVIMGVHYFDVYQTITDIGWKMNNELSGRIHAWMWIAFDPCEVLAWSGPPVAAFFIMAVARGAAAAIKRDWRALDPWLIALAIFLLCLDLSGKVVYEASRLAWFCFPLIAVAAARTAPLPGPRRVMIRPAVILGLQAISTVVFRLVF